jgi:hypothetical protein
MRFLIDAQLPPALARWLAAHGHEAEHVGDVGMQTASDTAIWDYALRENVAIITKDEDFAQRKVLAPGTGRDLDQSPEHPAKRSARMVRCGAAQHPVGAWAWRHADRADMKRRTRFGSSAKVLALKRTSDERRN